MKEQYLIIAKSCEQCGGEMIAKLIENPREQDKYDIDNKMRLGCAKVRLFLKNKDNYFREVEYSNSEYGWN